ncbi:MAG: hypothetical protein ACYTEO_15115 [Planctomycetota bacterium]|jgi:hypothetical protein
MFLSEMVRHVGDEVNVINDATEYSRTDSAWGTLHDYGTVNPATAGIYIIKFEIDSLNANARFRLKIGGNLVFGHVVPYPSPFVQHAIILHLPTGSQSVIAEAKTDTVYIKNFQMGRCEFSDVDSENLQVYSSTLTLNLSSRALPIGTSNKACLAINCGAYTSGAQTNFENIGDSLTNGVSLSVEGSQVDWTDRTQDSGSDEYAWAEYFGVEDLDEDITVTFTKDNGSTVVTISIIYCPWILPDVQTFEPIALSFPQGSTIYLMLEPLMTNPTKNIKIGKTRAISWGDTTDFYSTASGTNILQHDYQFVEVKNGAVLLYTYGRGGCISSIGVDIR